MALKYEDLAPKRQKFVDSYLVTGDRNDAYREAGYSIEGRGWRANARKMYLELTSIIQDRIDLKISQGAIIAMRIVSEIMQDPTVSSAVRLNAAKDYLQRAGYDKPQETNISVSDTREIKDEDLQAEIETLLRIVK